MNKAGPHSIAQPAHEVRSEFYAPPAEFDGCFTTFYRLDLSVEGDGLVEDYLQPEWANLRFFAGATPTTWMPGAAKVSGARFSATGPSSQPAHFTLGSCRMWGIGLLPLGWSRLIDVDARSLANVAADGATHPAFSKFTPLMDVLCDESVEPQAQFDEIVRFMRGQMRPCRDEDKIVRVHRALVDTKLASVADFAERSGMSARTLERVCQRYFGFTPKLLMRRQRFTRSLASYLLHHGSKWTEVMDEHYHDQAQFTREFHEFMTMNPSEYAALEHPVLASFVEARARIWGSPAQALDEP